MAKAPRSGAFGSRAKRQRERKPDRRAVGALRLAREFERLEIADPRRAKRIRIGRAAAFQRQHGKALAARQEIAVERAERKMPRAVRHGPRRVAEAEQFQIDAGQLDDVIFRAPLRRMTVARADGEAQPPIEIGGGVEIAHRMHDVVEAARHAGCDAQRIAENAVGRSIEVLMLAISRPSFSLSSRALCHSASAWNAFHFCSRSASDSHASR